MLFVLSGDMQTGKTRWLQGLVKDLVAAGCCVGGVVAPGVWKDWRGVHDIPTGAQVDDNGFEKLGIDNVLLPQEERVAFARRRDLVVADGRFQASQSERAGMRWSIADDAIARVNAHLARCLAGMQAPGLLVVDELGQLELVRGGGLTQAIALLEAGPTSAVQHALVTVRAELVPKLAGRFSAWGEQVLVRPDASARQRIVEAVLGLDEPQESGVPMPLHDMHCHLDFTDNACELARSFAEAGGLLYNCTVTPAGYERARTLLGEEPNVRVGLGMHPWWVSEGRVGLADVGRFCELARGLRWIGEVGLDFGKRHEATSDVQLAAFERVVDACREGGKLVSLHAVRSATRIMDMLEEAGVVEGNDFIFHWFSGSSPELTRAIKLGFHFSVNPMMLATRRGRAYLKAIPTDRLLMESDLPEENAGTVDFARFRTSLEETAKAIREAKGEGALDVMDRTARRLLCC